MGINSAVESLGKVMGLLCAGYFYEANIEFPYISGAVVSIVGLIVCIIWMRAGNRKAGRKDTDCCEFSPVVTVDGNARTVMMDEHS